MRDGNGSGIIPIGGADVGETKFAIDLSLGVVHITVRAPFAIEGVTGTVTVLDFLDFAAQTTLEMNKQHRAAIEQFIKTGARS